MGKVPFRFYQTMPEVLKPFAPSFEGTMKVETAEDEEGYIMLRGQPPPNYHREDSYMTSSLKLGRRGSISKTRKSGHRVDFLIKSSLK